ncbi:MAG: hypothetical protein M1133_01520 [Armatimonadetes bacterium]|nr:hypothetical protein [Armatimonadota bacterium]
MRNKCCEYEEAIWEHARNGAALSEDAQRHIERCSECDRALREAQRLSGVMRDSDSVPPFPDCRSAVMARISAPARRFNFAWTYACAAVLVAAVGLAYVIRPGVPATEVTATKTQSPPTGTRIALGNREQGTGNRRDRAVRPRFEPRTQVPRALAPTQHPAMHRRVAISESPPQSQSGISKSLHVRPSNARQHHPVVVAAAPPAPIAELKANIAGPVKLDMPTTGGVGLAPPQPPTSSSQPLADDTRPVAIAVVTWPSASDQPADNYAYSYTQRDPDTGAVTDCSVKRSGNSIDIRMEVKPEKKEPPIRGSVDCETNSNA